MPIHRWPKNQRRVNRRTKRRTPTDPIRLGRRLTRQKAAALVITLIVIVLIALLDRLGGVLPVDDDWHRYHGQAFEVLRVVDGDTLDLRVPDGQEATTRVRLWGVNTPEMGKPGSGESPEPWAQAATDLTRSLVQGQQVRIYLQPHRLRGRYGRLLAYVLLPDGRELNAVLIESGLSPHDDRWGHDQAEVYDSLEQSARQQKRGIWAP